jgi:hypothetical protein
VPVQFKTVSVPGGSTGITMGEHWSDTWQFTPACSATRCTMKDSAEFAPPSLGVATFTVNLSPSGSGYSGSTTAKLTTCNGADVTNTITLYIAPNSGAVSHGGWTAWNGTMSVSSPYVQANSTYYCPQQSWQFSLSGGS